MLKGKDIFNRRTAEAVNTLVVITHHADILILIGKKRGKNILSMVCVLILIDHNITKLSLIKISYLFVILKKHNGIIDNIVKIHCISLFKLALISLITLGNLGFSEIVCRGSLIFFR